MLASILCRLGDINRVRWLFFNALGDDICNAQVGSSSDTKQQTAQVKYMSDHKSRLRLWEEFLRIELSLGMSSVSRISEIRSRVVNARCNANAHALQPKISNAETESNILFDYASELYEKHAIPGVSLPLADSCVKDRCRGPAYIDELVRAADPDSSSSEQGGKNAGRSLPVPSSLLDADSSILAGLPAFFKEVLSKLPAFNEPTPDIDAFIDNLRRTVLPPRPREEFNTHRQKQNEIQSNSAPSILGKRNRPADVHMEAAYEGSIDVIEDGDVGVEREYNYNYEVKLHGDDDDNLSLENRDDIFKRRHRQKLIDE